MSPSSLNFLIHEKEEEMVSEKHDCGLINSFSRGPSFFCFLFYNELFVVFCFDNELFVVVHVVRC